MTPHSEEVYANLVCDEVGLNWLRCGPVDFRFDMGEFDALRDRCFTDLRPVLVDAVTSKLLANDISDILIVYPSSIPQMVWLVSMLWYGSSWQLRASLTHRPPSVDTSYAITDRDEQSDELLGVHTQLLGLIGNVLPKNRSFEPSRLLRIKVHSSERWFGRFPIGVFIKRQLEGFDTNSACQWIMSHRSITEVVLRQRAIEDSASDTLAFLSGVKIFMNTYNAHKHSANVNLVDDGFKLLMEVIAYLQNLKFENKTLNVCWTMNASPSDIEALLEAPETRFVYANFEAAGGVWSTGDCEFLTSADSRIRVSSPGQIDLTRLDGRLSHIDLLRAFHCNSLYDPYRPDLDPGHSDSLISSLIRTDVMLVEGSSTSEPILDFVCTVLKEFLDRSDVREIMFAHALSSGRDLNEIIGRTNRMLETRAFAAVAAY